MSNTEDLTSADSLVATSAGTRAVTLGAPLLLVKIAEASLYSRGVTNFTKIFKYSCIKFFFLKASPILAFTFMVACLMLTSSTVMADNDDIKAIISKSAESNSTTKISSYWSCGTKKGNFNFVLFNSSGQTGHIYVFNQDESVTKIVVKKWLVSSFGRRSGSIRMSIDDTSDSYIEIARLATPENKPISFAGAVKLSDMERSAVFCREEKSE